jgi:hypothetical protein
MLGKACDAGNVSLMLGKASHIYLVLGKVT